MIQFDEIHSGSLETVCHELRGTLTGGVCELRDCVGSKDSAVSAQEESDARKLR